jgi:hypothetical protein
MCMFAKREREREREREIYSEIIHKYDIYIYIYIAVCVCEHCTGANIKNICTDMMSKYLNLMTPRAAAHREAVP